MRMTDEGGGSPLLVGGDLVMTERGGQPLPAEVLFDPVDEDVEEVEVSGASGIATNILLLSLSRLSQWIDFDYDYN